MNKLVFGTWKVKYVGRQVIKIKVKHRHLHYSVVTLVSSHEIDLCNKSLIKKSMDSLLVLSKFQFVYQTQSNKTTLG